VWDRVSGVACHDKRPDNCPFMKLTTQFIDDVCKAIQTMQGRGQVVSYAGIEVMMAHWHGSADLDMIKGAVQELLTHQRIATEPL